MENPNISLYKQVYLISKDEYNSRFKTVWVSEKVALIGKKIKVSNDDRIWTILEVYPDIKTLNEISNIPNQLKNYNSYRRRNWEDEEYNPKTGK